MMNQYQAEVVRNVYTRFMESEEDDWHDLDDNLELIEGMTDLELINECHIKYDQHSIGPFRCKIDHDLSDCFAPHILEAVEIILNLYGETEGLHIKNRYILSFYLAMSELRIIFSM